MASKYYGDMCFSDGEYEKDGQKKKTWAKFGSVFKDEETGRLSVKSCLFSKEGRWFNIFEKKPKPQQQNQEKTYTQPGNEYKGQEPPPPSDGDEPF